MIRMKQKTVRLIVDLRDAREVERLRAKVKKLEGENERLRRLNKRYEFDLVCQQKINLQLSDYCKEHGYKVPPRMFTLWQSSHSPEEEI